MVIGQLSLIPFTLQSKKINQLKLGPIIYVLQCTSYVRKNVHLGYV
jgi:hypothetical protein